MGMIFPGMDPYLEDPWTWSEFHSRFIVNLAEFLLPLLRPRYVAGVEQRVFVEGPDRSIVPDVAITRGRRRAGPSSVGVLEMEADAPDEVVVESTEVRETYVTILDLRSGRRVVATIELLSPTNKYAGPGQASYLKKQAEVLASDSHLVEIDLLRQGPHVLSVPEWAAKVKGPYDYLTCTNRAIEDRSRFQIHRRMLRNRLPRVGIPLAEGDRDVAIDLQAVLAYTYEKAGYRDRLDYSRPCVPPLSPEDQAWADGLIREAIATEAKPAGPRPAGPPPGF